MREREASRGIGLPWLNRRSKWLLVSIALVVVGLSGAAIATGSCGGGGESSGLTVTKDPTVFSGAGNRQTLTITNTGTGTIYNLQVGLQNGGSFKLFKNCSGASIESGNACLETVECLVKGAEDTFYALSTTPNVGASAKLDC